MFEKAKIGIKDSNNIELFNGDEIIIEVAKNVNHIGFIVYDYGCFCLKRKRKDEGLYYITPLRNYADYCKITKII